METAKKTRCMLCNIFDDSVKGKVEDDRFDLHAFNVIYHQQCYFNFVTKKNIPKDIILS